MSTAEKIFQKARTLPEPAQAIVLELVESLTKRASGDASPLTREEAAEMRGHLGAWEEDWNAPGMEAYDRP
jgi:hypothetical protein